MRKLLLVGLVLLPLTAGASNALKETIKMKRKYDHNKHRITNTINNTQRNIKELSNGTYVENQLKREVNQATDKYTDKVDRVKNMTNPNEIKRRAKNEANRQFDEWLYEE
ncbi:hypothetical protein ACQEXU_15245 [Vibrio sp. TRT 21S02]|uniref:hypothetical protein n=1 Tax=unclassified Vibrio TaxID=2614977 RepID=UPI00349F4FAE